MPTFKPATRRSFPFLFPVILITLITSATCYQHTRAAGVLYAAPTVNGAGDCSSWENACRLETALLYTAAGYGDTVWVKKGVHHPTESTNANAEFWVRAGISLYGGFAGDETVVEERDWLANPTVLSGDITHDDLNLDGNFIDEDPSQRVGTNSYVVVVTYTTNPASNPPVIDSVIITAGGGLDEEGGGMYNYGGNPILRDVLFIGNNSERWGGGLYTANGDPDLERVTFVNNIAKYYGGGVAVYGGSISLHEVTFRGNQAQYGGGMYTVFNGSCDADLVNVTFQKNTASAWGGGMQNNACSPSLVNTLFTGNSVTHPSGAGAAMMNYGASYPSLVNVTMTGNSASGRGGGILNQSSTPTLVNTIIWGNTATLEAPGIYNVTGIIGVPDASAIISYSDIQGSGGSGGWNSAIGVDGGHNIDLDPHFADADGPDGIFGTPDDLPRLLLDSPAIDTGLNSALPAGVLTDLLGWPRVLGGTIDLGAYEFGLPSFIPMLRK